MTQSKNISGVHDLNYWKSILENTSNRKSLYLGTALILLSFAFFKILYPYPDFFSDSYNYIFAAKENLDISFYPIGYSKFLAVVHALTHSGTALVAIQYFLIQLAALNLYFTTIYFFNLAKWAQKTLFLFLFVNPLTLYLANTINSDALFAGLSLFWLTELIWILHRPHIYQIFVQALLLFLCFTIRNNAYFYPLVAAVAFILSQQHISRKIIGITFPLLFLIPFIFFTRNAAYRLTGTRQYSLFTGWQLANNALYIYDQVALDSAIFSTTETKELNRIAIRFFTHVKPEIYRNFLESYVGNLFIREPQSPLKQYYSAHFNPKDDLMNVVDWAKASQTFESFGKPIILRNPFAYIRYFVYPNAWHYFIPPLSHLERYNYGVNNIDPIAQSWFDYKKPYVHVFSHEFQGKLLTIYQGLFLVINLYYLWWLLDFFRRKQSLQKTGISTTPHLLIAIFFFLNLGFSLIATVNILRYQFVPMTICLVFALVLDDSREKIVQTSKTLTVKKMVPLSQSEVLGSS